MPRQRKQPVREIPAESHGDRQATTQLQSAAPMSAPPQLGEGTPVAPTSPAAEMGGGPPPPPPISPVDVFAPSSNPRGQAAPSILPSDELAPLRALYQKYPSEDLRRLMERAIQLQRSRMTSG